MANYNYKSQFVYSNAGMLCKLLVKVSIGASGAPTIMSRTGMGITSVVRTAAGAYTITLSKPFNTLLGLSGSFLSGSSAPAAPAINIVSETVATLASPQVKIQTRNAAGTATDPASGEILILEIDLNSSRLSN